LNAWRSVRKSSKRRVLPPRLRNQRGLEGGARAVEEASFLELEKSLHLCHEDRVRRAADRKAGRRAVIEE